MRFIFLLRTFLISSFLLLGLVCNSAAQKTARIGQPMPDSLKKQSAPDTVKMVQRIGNYTLIRMPKAVAPPAPKIKVSSTEPASKGATPANYGRVAVGVYIKLMEAQVRSLKELIVYITITNTSSGVQNFLFDKPYRPGIGPWQTECYIRKNGVELTQKTNRMFVDPNVYKPDYLAIYKTSLLPKHWAMKGYPVTSLVSFPEEIEKLQKLPAGSYDLQISYMGMLSNTVSFTMR